MTRVSGYAHIVISKNDLAIRCDHCGKGEAYQTGQTIATWNRRLRLFIFKHQYCEPKKA
jgi:hypothetical protein